jgi:hypothetical protein
MNMSSSGQIAPLSCEALAGNRIFRRLFERIIELYGHTTPVGEVFLRMVTDFHWREGEEVTVTGLASRYGFPRSTVSRVIAALIDEGRAREVIDADDRRRRLLVPTDEGVACAAAWGEWIERAMREEQQRERDSLLG